MRVMLRPLQVVRRRRQSAGAALMSMLRPERTSTVGPLGLTLPASSAAMPTAPAPSTISRSCVIGVADAGGDLVLGEQDDVVEQVAAHGEGQPVVEPDAAAERVGQRRQLLDRHRRPASRLACIAAPRAIETPITRDRRLERLDGGGDAGGQPAARKRHERRSRLRASSSTISSPSVPCPAMTAGMVEGRQHRPAPPPRPAGRPPACASSWLLPTMRTSAPSRRISSTLFAGTSRDMQITARRPSRCRRMGERAAMIAGRGGDDAAPALVGGERARRRWWRRAA